MSKLNKGFDAEEWLREHEDYETMVELLGEYDPFLDYVGPAEQKWLSKMIPRRLLLLCDVNVCAYKHDYYYQTKTSEVERLEADLEFLRDMYYITARTDFAVFVDIPWIKLLINFYIDRMANTHALYYYSAVRTFGKFFNNNADE